MRSESLNADHAPAVDVEQERILTAVLIGLLSILCILLQFTFRGFDDNRLTSWLWVFDSNQLLFTCLLIVLLLFVCWEISWQTISEKKVFWLMGLLSFLISIPMWGVPEVNIDASRYFSQAKYLSLFGVASYFMEWGREIPTWTDLPLIPFIYGVLLRVFGESREVIQVAASLFFSATVMLTYMIGKELWNERTGMYGGILLLGIPFLITQIPLTLVDIPTMFFLTLTVFAAIRTFKTGTGGWLLATPALIFLTLLSKYSTWLMLTVIPVIALVMMQDKGTRALTYAVQVAIGCGFLIMLFLVFKYDVIASQVKLLFEYQLPGLARWHESHVSTFFYQIHPFLSLLAALSIFIAFKNRDCRYLILCWMIFLLILLGVQRIRYILPAFPMLTLMAGYAMSRIPDQRIGRFLAMAIVVSSVTVAYSGHVGFLKSTTAMNMKMAGEYIEKSGIRHISIVVEPQRNSMVNPLVTIPIMDLYTSAQIYNHNPVTSGMRIPDKHIATSPTRFTWETGLPKYYDTGSIQSRNVMLVISDSGRQGYSASLSEALTNYHLLKKYDATEGVFRFATIVEIYAVRPLQTGRSKELKI